MGGCGCSHSGRRCPTGWQLRFNGSGDNGVTRQQHSRHAPATVAPLQGANVTDAPAMIQPTQPTITIPADLLPSDGRFGSGPSKVRPAQVERSPRSAARCSARRTARRRSRTWSARVREGLRSLFDLPEGYEVVLGNGGATAFWDIAAFGLVRDRAQHLTFGEFSSKFATVTQNAPFLGEPTVISSEPGHRSPSPRAEAGIDVYAWAHNETSTGVMAPVQRVAGRRRRRARPRRRHLRRRRPARSTSARPTSTTSPRRSASPPTAGSGSRSSRPPRSRAWRRSPRRAAGCPTSSACPPRSTTAD